MTRPEVTYFRARPADPGAFKGPPRACLLCLFGLCHRCTGRMVVRDVHGGRRDEACEHQHRPGRGPVARVIADIPVRSRS
ncbi:hypothetical protein O7626_39510 [Micromonospora sp. WMMD1102]|uniref:hypothetical protein n=1 Tax=Micromonospora sp. WMMD1102 TaxID=3016105 RepID=UPI00241531C7|nr:hypothetical protein [Micromonospora sp. WMMD1102]MDG4784400.1 hypothetical protein [Micromonospora sp. WMMD1102]MDG4791904.1 hypothetical protein [Micromonospora sp. WMMD1102]